MTVYTSEFCALAVEMGKEGKTKTAIAAACGVSRNTVYDWMEAHEEFGEAIKESVALAQAWWENILRSQATGSEGNATSAIFAMKNQFPDQYRDRREHTVEHAGFIEIDFLGYEPDADEPAQANG